MDRAYSPAGHARDAPPHHLYVDADACPVKQEVYRVAERFVLRGTALKVVVVSNAPIVVPRADFIERVVVGGGMDEADNYIAERAGRGDIVITADVPLAARAVKAGAEAIAPNGKPFTEDAIGMTLATRNLMSDLRSAGEITSGPKPFARAGPLALSLRRSTPRSCGSRARASANRTDRGWEP